jgi:hypothetical protein
MKTKEAKNWPVCSEEEPKPGSLEIFKVNQENWEKS